VESSALLERLGWAGYEEDVLGMSTGRVPQPVVPEGRRAGRRAQEEIGADTPFVGVLSAVADYLVQQLQRLEPPG
jgi:hypothetical protein